MMSKAEKSVKGARIFNSIGWEIRRRQKVLKQNKKK